MELARGAQRDGWEVQIFCLRDGTWAQGGWGQDVKINAFGPGYRLRFPWTVIAAVRWLQDQLTQFDPHIIHVNHAAWWIASYASRKLSAGTIWHLHDYPDRRDLPTHIGVHRPPSHSIFTTRKVASGYPELAKRAHSIIPPVTIDASEFASLDRDGSILDRQGLGKMNYFLTVCRWQPHKGIHDLIDAVASAVKTDDLPADTKFVLVGKTSNPGERRYHSSVLHRIQQQQVEGRLVLIEQCTDAELRSLYSNAIGLVHPAHTEGFGLVLIEAMSLGTPVIACDASGPLEVLDDGRCGWVVPGGDPQSLSEAIVGMAQSVSKRQSLSELGLRRCRELSRDRMVSSTLEIYNHLALQR